MAKSNDLGGVWRTINGNHVFIKDGQTVAEALEEDKKKKAKLKETENKPKEEKKQKEKDVIKDTPEHGHAFDVGNYTEEEMHKNAYSYTETDDGLMIGDGDVEGIEPGAKDRVIYNMSEERLENLTPEERIALEDIANNNREIDELIQENTDIYNNETSRSDWVEEHRGENGNHTPETKSIEEYHAELSDENKEKIKANEERINELYEDSLQKAEILKTNEGKYPITPREERWQATKEELLNSKAENTPKEPVMQYESGFHLESSVNDFDAAQAYLSDDDMTQYLPEELKGKISSAEWILDDDESGRVVIKATEELTPDETKALQDWIDGQNSDGLGEGFEQQEFATSYWNPETGEGPFTYREFEQEQERMYDELDPQDYGDYLNDDVVENAAEIYMEDNGFDMEDEDEWIAARQEIRDNPEEYLDWEDIDRAKDDYFKDYGTNEDEWYAMSSMRRDGEMTGTDIRPQIETHDERLHGPDSPEIKAANAKIDKEFGTAEKQIAYNQDKGLTDAIRDPEFKNKMIEQYKNDAEFRALMDEITGGPKEGSELANAIKGNELSIQSKYGLKDKRNEFTVYEYEDGQIDQQEFKDLMRMGGENEDTISSIVKANTGANSKNPQIKNLFDEGIMQERINAGELSKDTKPYMSDEKASDMLLKEQEKLDNAINTFVKNNPNYKNGNYKDDDFLEIANYMDLKEGDDAVDRINDAIYDWEKQNKPKKSSSKSISDNLSRAAYNKYLKEHPGSKISFEDFKKKKK